MKTLRVLIITVILTIILTSNALALDDFVRGIWLTCEAFCVEYPAGEGCCYDSIDWERELSLLQNAKVNLINSHMGPAYEREWMDNVCNASSGQIKMYIGVNGIEPYAMEITELGYTAWRYPDAGWVADVEDTLQACYDEYYSDEGFFGYYLAHEWHLRDETEHDYYEWYPGLEYMASYVDNTLDDTLHMTGIVNHINSAGTAIRREFADSVTSLDIIELDQYVFQPNVKDSGQSIVNALNVLTARYDSMYAFYKDKTTIWMPIIQVCAFGGGSAANNDLWRDSCYVDSTNFIHHCPRNPNWLYNMRFCSREEIRLQAFLGISRGAKGIILFSWGTAYGSWRAWGIVEHCYTDSARQEFKPINHQDTTLVWFWNYARDETPYEHIVELFTELERIGPTIMKLYVTGVDGYKNESDANNPDSVAFIKALKGDYDYFEVATFKDTAHVDSSQFIDYFMLVNRITSMADTLNHQAANYQTATVHLTRPEGIYPFIEDISSNEQWIIASIDSTVNEQSYFHLTDSVGPGDGNIYRVSDALKDTLDENLTLYHDSYVIGDLVINADDTLTIREGVTLYVKADDGVDITVNGTLIADGKSYARCKITSWNEYSGSPEAGDWNRITFGKAAHGDLSYCDIKYTNYAIRMKDTSEVNLDHCLIQNISYHGLTNDKGKLSATNCSFENVGYSGILSSWAESVIDSCNFEWCEEYAIVAYYGPTYASLDSTLITNCTIGNGDYIPVTSQYGIMTDNIDNIRIEDNYIRTYAQGGIYLYNSDAIVHSNDFVMLGAYGIYANNYSDAELKYCEFDSVSTAIYCNDNSSPYIRACYFDKADVGILSHFSCEPDIGYNTTGQYGNSDFEGCDDYYIRQTGFGVWPRLWAEKNWFGSGTPDTSMFVGLIDYSPWLTRKPPRLGKFINDFAGDIPTAYALSANYPNPFNPTTMINYSLANSGYTVIEIYNVLGQRITSLVNEYQEAGEHAVMWNGCNASGDVVSSGVYFYRIASGEFVDTKKMLLLH